MIGITQAEAVLTIELQRPERRNALNSQLVEELTQAIRKAGDGSARAIVLTGQGTAFCAGADLSGDAFAADYPDRLIELHKAMDASPMPVVGAINGPAIGAGLQLAMQCDLRVVAPDAFFQFPTSKYGLALDNWSIRRLSSLIGHGRARAMLLSAEKLTAEIALHTGMANRIGTLADAQAWAAEIARLAPLAIQHAKRVLNDDGAIEEAWPAHKELFDKAWGQPGCHRSAGCPDGKAAAEVPRGLTVMVRRALRLAAGTASLAAGTWLLRALHGTPAALGADAASIRAVSEQSPNYRDGAFVNLDPASMFTLDREELRLIVWELVARHSASRPAAPIPLASPNIYRGDASRLAVSWFGHSTALLEIDGYRVLTDPVWSDRCSPSDVVGPQRLHPPPVQLAALPAVDAVVISHDHYDHLDIDTVVALVGMQRAPFLVPLGVGAHLRSWGVPQDRIVELDWNQSAQVDELTVVCVPARHFSGRFLSRNTTLWASWAFVGPNHRAYFGGDTGYTKSFTQIGADHGPFDLTLLPIGAYNTAWPDIHMNPEEAVRAHLDVTDSGSGMLVPVHWGTFRLAPHPWGEPVERLLAAAEPEHVTVAVPLPGQRVDPTGPMRLHPWWRL